MWVRGSITGAFYFLFRLANTNLFFFSCLPNVSHVFKLSAFAMVFLATRDIKSGEQLFYSYCAVDQSASGRKADLAPYGIALCIRSSSIISDFCSCILPQIQLEFVGSDSRNFLNRARDNAYSGKLTKIEAVTFGNIHCRQHRISKQKMSKDGSPSSGVIRSGGPRVSPRACTGMFGGSAGGSFFIRNDSS